MSKPNRAAVQQRVAEITPLKQEGYSNITIASVLGLTLGCVTGLVRRHVRGIVDIPRPWVQRKKAVREISTRSKPAPKAEPPKVIHLELVSHGKCHFPLGDPRTLSFRFCDAPIETEGHNYCDRHWRLAHLPIKKPPGVP